MGARPEDIILVGEKDSMLSVEVMVVEPQGSFQIIAVEIENEIVKIVVPSADKIVPGEKLHLSFVLERLHFFDPETTERI